MPYPIPKNLNIYVELKSFQPKHEMLAPEVYTDFYGVSYIVQGDRKLITPNMISVLKAGDVGFTTKNMYHRATYLTQMPYSRYLIKFTEKSINNLLEKLQLSNIDDLLRYPVYHFHLESQQKIQLLFSQMLHEFNNYNKYSEILLESMLIQLLVMVKCEHMLDPTSDLIIKNANEEILNAIYYIDLHVGENPNMDEVASYIGFSASHFSRLFKQHTGITYSSYVTSVKLQRAMSMLIHTNHTIETIACACGFPDASYLCHIFKEKYHLSPSNYRKRGCLE